VLILGTFNLTYEKNQNLQKKVLSSPKYFISLPSMSIQVKSIDVQTIEERLRKDKDKETLQYIKALKEALDRQRDITNLAISIIKRYAEKYGNIE
jgi:hypothetical protein